MLRLISRHGRDFSDLPKAIQVSLLWQSAIESIQNRGEGYRWITFLRKKWKTIKVVLLNINNAKGC
jgi:hypothetical protein